VSTSDGSASTGGGAISTALPLPPPPPPPPWSQRACRHVQCSTSAAVGSSAGSGEHLGEGGEGGAGCSRLQPSHANPTTLAASSNPEAVACARHRANG